MRLCHIGRYFVALRFKLRWQLLDSYGALHFSCNLNVAANCDSDVCDGPDLSYMGAILAEDRASDESAARVTIDFV